MTIIILFQESTQFFSQIHKWQSAVKRVWFWDLLFPQISIINVVDLCPRAIYVYIFFFMFLSLNSMIVRYK